MSDKPFNLSEFLFVITIGCLIGAAVGILVTKEDAKKQKAQVICSSDSITQVEEWEWNDGVLSVQVDGATVYPPCTCAFVVLE